MKEITVSAISEIRSGYHKFSSNLFPGIPYIVYDSDASALSRQSKGITVAEPLFGDTKWLKSDDPNGKGLLYFASGNYRDLLLDIHAVISLQSQFPDAAIDLAADMDVLILFRQFGFKGGWQRYPVPSDLVERYDLIFSNEFIRNHSVIPGKELLSNYLSRSPSDFAVKGLTLSLDSGIEKATRLENEASPLAMVHVSSENSISDYPAHGFSRLIQLLSDEGIRVFLTGFSTDIEGLTAPNCVNLIGRHTSIIETLAVISRADLIIGPDSFATRAGGMLDIPTIALLNINDPDLYALYPSVETMQSKECCVPCYRFDKCPLGYDACKAFGHESVAPEKILKTALFSLRSGMNKSPVGEDREEGILNHEETLDKFFEKSREDGRFIDGLLQKAREYLKRGELASSLKTLEEAAKLDPANPVPYLRAAAIMRRLGKKTEWLALMDKGISCDSSHFCQDHETALGGSPVRSPIKGIRRVLILASKTGMVCQDCAHGFEKLGWQVILELFGDNSHEGPEAHEDLAFKIRKHEPCLVLSINHVGCDADGFILSFLRHTSIPVVIWYVDNPFALLPDENSKMVEAATLLACFDSSYVDRLEKKTGVSTVHMPLGTNPERFRPSSGHAHHEKWDISFVGNTGLDMAERQRSEFQKCNPSISPIVDAFVNRMGTDSFTPVHSLLKASARSLGIEWGHIPWDVKERLTMTAESHASALKRIHTVSRLRSFNIRVIGGPEWRPYLANGNLFPPVDYLTGLCEIYQKSLINLNISRLQLRSGVTQRIFDVPATKGFLLTDRTFELDRYLEPGKEIAFYESADEAKEKVAYYHTHGNEREEIALMAYQRVTNEHTYTHRIKRLLDILGSI